MSEPRADPLARQAALYGEPLSARFGRVLAAFRIPQSRLATTIGLSAPMLSQLASGQRVKISNPAVYARLLRLEELAETASVRSGEPAVLAAALEQVAASRPTLTTEHAAVAPDAVATALARLAGPEELAAAAAAVPSTRLGELLQAAARRAGET